MSISATTTSLCRIPTSRFAILDVEGGSSKRSNGGCQNSHVHPTYPPVIAWEDLIFHERRQTTQSLHDALKQYLSEYGFCFFDVSHPHALNVIQTMRESLHDDFFPPANKATEATPSFSSNNSCITTNDNNSSINRNQNPHLHTSTEIYVSEKGIPMYQLGYEYTRIREIFRIAGKNPDSVRYPSERVRSIWIQGLGLMRDTTDAALDVLLLSSILSTQNGTKNNNNEPPKRQRRAHYGATWTKPPVSTPILQDREGDFSVLYAMHYFNDPCEREQQQQHYLPEPGVAVKEHVDPSVLVLEPFLCETSVGLQIWNRTTNTANHGINTNTDDASSSSWLDCDGPHSIFSQKQQQQQQQQQHQDGRHHHWMLLFCGKALSEHVPSIAPTRHRVVAGSDRRCTIIYEQKYQEFFPPPTFD